MFGIRGLESRKHNIKGVGGGGGGGGGGVIRGPLSTSSGAGTATAFPARNVRLLSKFPSVSRSIPRSGELARSHICGSLPFKTANNKDNAHSAKNTRNCYARAATLVDK